MTAVPPYDTQLAEAFAAVAGTTAGLEPAAVIETVRGLFRELDQPLDALLAGTSVEHAEHRVPGPAGAQDVLVSVFSRRDAAPGPALVYFHGGGLVAGTRLTGIESLIDWVDRLGIVVVSVEYRLAPEHPDPAPRDDCYAALLWTWAHAAELGIDARRLGVIGGSAGGGLAAGVALRARDEAGPHLATQMLICPMLDHRSGSVSSAQFAHTGGWDTVTIQAAWAAALGEDHASGAVSAYVSPALATDLGGLPPTYLDVGSAEVFRDEVVSYASGIWAAGGVADLHVWARGFHGFDGTVPTARVSQASVAAREAWVQRMLLA